MRGFSIPAFIVCFAAILVLSSGVSIGGERKTAHLVEAEGNAAVSGSDLAVADTQHVSRNEDFPGNMRDPFIRRLAECRGILKDWVSRVREVLLREASWGFGRFDAAASEQSRNERTNSGRNFQAKSGNMMTGWWKST